MIRTVADPAVLHTLIARLRALTPYATRRWGTLTPHEMLCHLGDAADMALRRRPRSRPVPVRRRPLMKALLLWSPVRWPRGIETNPSHDPRRDGTRPTVFEDDMDRAVAGLEAIARHTLDDMEPAHGFFGAMSVRDWQRWAHKHTAHHLRQFGL